MHKIIISCFLLVLIAIFCRADYVSSYKIINIQHPVLDYQKPKPLIINYQIVYNKTEVRKQKIVCNPMFNLKFYVSNSGEEYVAWEESNIRYRDAYIRPDKKGFIIFEKETVYDDESSYCYIKLFDLSKDISIVLEPYGYYMYFTKDLKYLVTMYDDGYEGEEPKNATVFYYDLGTQMGELVKTMELPYLDFKKLPLIPLDKEK